MLCLNLYMHRSYYAQQKNQCNPLKNLKLLCLQWNPENIEFFEPRARKQKLGRLENIQNFRHSSHSRGGATLQQWRVVFFARSIRTVYFFLHCVTVIRYDSYYAVRVHSLLDSLYLLQFEQSVYAANLKPLLK